LESRYLSFLLRYHPIGHSFGQVARKAKKRPAKEWVSFPLELIFGRCIYSRLPTAPARFNRRIAFLCEASCQHPHLSSHAQLQASLMKSIKYIVAGFCFSRLTLLETASAQLRMRERNSLYCHILCNLLLLVLLLVLMCLNVLIVM
jgi:hypothetical protein